MKCTHDDEENYSCIECEVFEECWEPIIESCWGLIVDEANEKLAEIEKLRALQLWKRMI